jgi:hypothetical protein
MTHKRTALDALIEQDEKSLAYWIERLENNKQDKFWTTERMQKTIDSLKFSLKYSKKHREEFRK